jgi:hypothetical protein
MSGSVSEYNKRLDRRTVSTFDAKILEGKLGPHNEKFDPNGTAKPFYGLTCIAWVDKGSELFRELCALQNTFRKEFQEAGLGNIFAFLEPESFHMTICDINASPIPHRCFAERLIETAQGAIERITQKHQGRVLSQVRGIGLKSTISALVRFDDKHELEKVYDMEREIKQSVLDMGSEIAQSTCVSFRDFAGHISIAYFVRHPGDNTDTVREILLPYENTVVGEFAFSQFDLTYFVDMNTYIPILTIDLENGEVTPRVSNIEMLKSITDLFKTARSVLEAWVHT